MKYLKTFPSGSIRLAAVLAAATPASLAIATPAFSQEALEIEANVALVTDYRFRGISLSDNDIALQGGFDISSESGFYAGVWGSGIEPVGGSELELDIYAGYGFEAGGVAFDIGALMYTYPGSSDTHYLEFYGSAGFAAAGLESTFGFAYAPEQDNIGNDDNLYLYYEGAYPLGDSGLSLTGSVGYETGSFGDPDGDGDDKWDWSLGVGWTALGVDWSLAYIDSSEDIGAGNGTGVLMISKAF
ncbi:MAG: TorF family putative porin [Caulobacterales bacterium]|uniref:TorF family putative porin n=1 Tax=Glycocaulis sp. TaxID=1969725 RepID=UPI003F9F4ED8